MATITAAAPWPATDGYTGAAGTLGLTSSPQATPPALARAPGASYDRPVYAPPTPRQAAPMGAQAARWLFPPVTAVPLASPFTRFPTAP